MRHVGGPTVSLSANWLRYQKTLSIDLAGPREHAQDRIDDFLSDLPSQLPPLLQAGATAAADRISAALPDLLGVLPDSLSVRARDAIFRPSITAVWPLYTGGATEALRTGAQNLVTLDLGRAYFGQQVADQLVLTSRQQLRSMEEHVHNARRLEAHGVLAHAQVLEIEVARDAALRNLERARAQQANARAELARLLAVPGAIEGTTPLFVHAQALPPLQEFLDSGLQDRADVQAARAASVAAGAAVDLAAAALRP